MLEFSVVLEAETAGSRMRGPGQVDWGGWVGPSLGMALEVGWGWDGG